MPDRPVFHFVNCIKHLPCSLVMSHHNHSRTMVAGDCNSLRYSGSINTPTLVDGSNSRIRKSDVDC
jgi:hypothetical protein